MVEQIERIGGAIFLGVPAFDLLVWALDNYARLELIVTLHDHLLAFVISPAMAFVCTVVGLGLLHLLQEANGKHFDNREQGKSS